MTDHLQFIDFYQLASDETGKLVAQLAEKSQTVSKKVVVHVPKDECQALSRALWVFRDLSFLAHGIDNEDGTEFAKIWISSQADVNPISAEFAICLSSVALPDMTAYERVFIVFNGNDEGALQAARAQWKAFATLYHGRCRYYAKTTDGRWEQKASA